MTQAIHPTVIIVDDEASVREAVASLLRSNYLHVLSFASAEEFLQSARPESVGCLILDINLPGMSGLELQLQCLMRPQWRGVPIIFITAREDRGDRMRAQAMRYGAHAFLPKPFINDELLHAVHSAMAS